MDQKISKLEVAKLQLISAIELFFNSDVVSAYTLARASHEILENLCDHQGLEKGVLQTGLSTLDPSMRKEVFDQINKARNFFKHGSHKSETVIKWNPDLIEPFLWEATAFYRRLVGDKDLPKQILVYAVWFRVKKSELWVDPSPIDLLIPGAKEELNGLDKKTIYKILMETPVGTFSRKDL